jgi:hypothetical protein
MDGQTSLLDRLPFRILKGFAAAGGAAHLTQVIAK